MSQRTNVEFVCGYSTEVVEAGKIPFFNKRKAPKALLLNNSNVCWKATEWQNVGGNFYVQIASLATPRRTMWHIFRPGSSIVIDVLDSLKIDVEQF